MMVVGVIYRRRRDYFAFIRCLFRKDLELLPIVVADQVILFPLAA